MRRAHWPSRLATSTALLAALVAGSCLGDASGPGFPRLGRFALAPDFESAAAVLVPIAQVRMVLERGDGTVALDTTITVQEAQQEVSLEASVVVSSPSETFQLTVEFIDPTGQVVFVGGPVPVQPTTDPSAPPVLIQLPLRYVGPGANAAAVVILSSNVSVPFGQTVQILAEARDDQAQPIPNTPIVWRSLDPLRATVPDSALNSVLAGTERGLARITATLLTGPADTISIDVLPVPEAITLTSGGGQSGTANQALSQPIVVAVTAVDGPLSAVDVQFQTLDGGSFAPSIAATDASGQAQSIWTLGSVGGTQAGTATVVGSPTIQTGFTATALTADRLVFSVQPSSTVANATIVPPLEVTAVDAQGVLDPNFTGAVTIGIANNPAGGTLSGNLTVNAVAGVATFGGLRIDQVGVGYTLAATATGLTSATSTPFAITAPPPGVVTWVNPAGGNWSTGSNWSTGFVPTAQDDVVITLDGSYTVTLDVDATVASLTLGGSTGMQTLSANGRSFTVTGNSNVGPNGQLTLSSSTLNGSTLTNQGRLEITNSVVNPALTTTATSLIVSSGTTSNIAAGFTNNGTLQISNTLFQTDGALAVGGALINAAGGTISPVSGAGGGNRTLTAALDNRGTLTVPVGLTINRASASHQNSGSIQVTGGDLTVNQSGTAPSFSTNGTIVIEVGRTMAVSGGTFDYSAGTLDGDGTLTLQNLTSTFTPAVTTDSLDLTLDGSTLNGAAITNSETAIITATNAASINVALNNEGAVILNNSTVTGALTTTATSVILTSGTTPSIAAGFTNNGALTISNNLFQTDGTLVVGGTLINGPDGLISPVSGAGGGNRTLTAELDNQGTVFLLVGLTIDRASAAHQNSGSILVTGGDLTVNQSGTTPSFSNSGTIDIGVSRTLTVAGGALTNQTAGTIQGQGTLDVSGSSFTDQGATNPGTSPGILSIIGVYNQSPTGTITFELDGLIAGAEHDQLNVSGASTLTGTLDVITSFTPNNGDSFLVMTFGSRTGVLTAVNGLDLGGGVTLDTVWTPTTLTLVARTPQPQIVFAGDSLGGTSGFYRVDPDGSNRVFWTPEGPSQLDFPRWSPDRTRIVYTTSNDIFTIPNLLHVGSPDGLQIAHLVNDTSTQRARYNPTGQHLAFQCGPAFGPDDVCVVANVDGPIASLDNIGDGAGKMFVTDLVRTRSGGVAAFAWDPANPNSLAFVRDSITATGAPASRIYTVNFDGTGLDETTFPSVMDAGTGPLQVVSAWLDYSPDGSQIVFAAIDPQFAQNIYRINRDGKGLVALTTGGADDDPLWAPNGLEILFTRDIGCSLDLYLMNADGSNQRQLTNEKVCDFNTSILGFDWSPDGSEIVLTGFNMPFGSVLIYVIKRTTTAATYFADRRLVGRGAVGSEVQDIQPSWRP